MNRLGSDWIRDSFTRMEYELEQWGLWHRTGAGCGTPLGSVLGQLRGSSAPTPNITDDRVTEIDEALVDLGDANRELQQTVLCRFRDRCRIHEVARELGVSGHRVRYELIPQGVRWLASRFYPGVGERADSDPALNEMRELLARLPRGDFAPDDELRRAAGTLRNDSTARLLWQLLRHQGNDRGRT